jgi:hypothetical protein
MFGFMCTTLIALQLHRRLEPRVHPGSGSHSPVSSNPGSSGRYLQTRNIPVIHPGHNSRKLSYLFTLVAKAPC